MSEQEADKKGYVVEDPGDEGSPEEKEAYSKLTEVFKDLPDNHYGVYENSTGKLLDLGSLDDAVGSVLFEDDQIQDLDRGVSHQVKFHTMYNMFNAEPDINQGLNLKSELPIGYGYRFKYEDSPVEFDDLKHSPMPRISTEYWNMWSQFVNYDHSLRQQFHSTYGMGNVWAEKVYDKLGMNRRGWGVRKIIVRSPDAMYNIVDGAGNILYFAQSIAETNRMFGDNLTIRHKNYDGFVKGLKENSKEPDQPVDIVKIDRHKIMYYNYNAYYDDTVYGYGAGIPLVSYARSKIGVQKRILRLIDNASSSLLVYKYGDKEYMVSGKAASKIFSKVKTQKAVKMVLLPWYFDVEEKELGKSVANFAPYLDYFANQESNGIGIPPFATGRGGSAEGAKLQMEILVRQLMAMQRIIRNHQRTQLFPECIVGNPKNSVLIPSQSWQEVEKELKSDKPVGLLEAAMYPYLKPVAFKDVPTLSWNIMEEVSDKRLRHEVLAKLGLVSEEELRAEWDYPGRVPDDDQNLPLRIELAKLEIEKLKIKSQEKIAEKQAKATAASKSPPSSTKK